MRVLVTGASGFVGEAVAAELTAHGQAVVGLARNDAAAAKIEAAGLAVARGDLDQPETLAAAARDADGVIHCAFDHDFSRFADNIAKDRRNVAALVEALQGTGKPLIITGGSGVRPGRVSTEEDAPDPDGNPRTLTENLVTDPAAGVRGMVVRLPQVHDTGDKAGFVGYLLPLAREKGFAAYIGDGANRWTAVHRRDLARLYRLALEEGEAGARLNGVAEEGIPMRAIAEAIGAGMGLPVRSLSPAEAADYFGWMAMFAGMDMPASSAITRRRFGWEPVGPTLFEDLKTSSYFG